MSSDNSFDLEIDEIIDIFDEKPAKPEKQESKPKIDDSISSLLKDMESTFETAAKEQSADLVTMSSPKSTDNLISKRISTATKEQHPKSTDNLISKRMSSSPSLLINSDVKRKTMRSSSMTTPNKDVEDILSFIGLGDNTSISNRLSTAIAPLSRLSTATSPVTPIESKKIESNKEDYAPSDNSTRKRRIPASERASLIKDSFNKIDLNSLQDIDTPKTNHFNELPFLTSSTANQQASTSINDSKRISKSFKSTVEIPSLLQSEQVMSPKEYKSADQLNEGKGNRETLRNNSKKNYSQQDLKIDVKARSRTNTILSEAKDFSRNGKELLKSPLSYSIPLNDVDNSDSRGSFYLMSDEEKSNKISDDDDTDSQPISFDDENSSISKVSVASNLMSVKNPPMQTILEVSSNHNSFIGQTSTPVFTDFNQNTKPDFADFNQNTKPEFPSFTNFRTQEPTNMPIFTDVIKQVVEKECSKCVNTAKDLEALQKEIQNLKEEQLQEGKIREQLKLQLIELEQKVL